MMPSSVRECHAATPLHTPLEATNTTQSTYFLHPRNQIHTTTSPSSFVIVRRRRSSFGFVHHHPVSGVMVQVQAKQIKRESENQSHTSRVKRTPHSNPCTRPLSLFHTLDVFMMPASACQCPVTTPLHTQHRQQIRKNQLTRYTHETKCTYITKSMPKHHQSVIVPFHSSSSRVGRHRAS